MKVDDSKCYTTTNIFKMKCLHMVTVPHQASFSQTKKVLVNFYTEFITLEFQKKLYKW